MLKAIISTWTLFFGLLLISAGNGLQVVLLGTRAPEAGFSNIATGIVMSGYFAGIFAGSIIVPHILARVGHVRVFGAMSAIACRHCDDVVVGAPARITDDICKTFNVTAVVFEDDASITAQDRKVCEKNGVEILSVREKHFSRKKITIAKRVQANRALFEARQKRKMASEAAYYEQKSFVAEE